MSKTKFLVLVTALFTQVAQGAQTGLTFAQLSDKNARFVELKADLAIARTEAELAEQKGKASGATWTGMPGGVVVPAIQVAPTSIAPMGTTKAATPVVDKPETILSAINGSSVRMNADFQRGGQLFSRAQGDGVDDGWIISSIAYPDVLLTRSATGKKAKDACKRLRIGMAVRNAPSC